MRRYNSIFKTAFLTVWVFTFAILASATADAAQRKHTASYYDDNLYGRYSFASYSNSGTYSPFGASSWADNTFFNARPVYAVAPTPVTKAKVSDPYYSSSRAWGQSYQDEWGLADIGLGVGSTIWERYTGAGIKIAVVDTGLSMGLKDISANVWNNTAEIAGNKRDDDRDGYVDDTRGWDFLGNDNDPTDQNGHGTHVAGIIAGAANGIGMVGVAPNATIIPVRVLDANGSGSITNVAKGIIYAASVGARVINLSLGAAGLDTYSVALLQAAVNYAVKLGDFVVAAAGNSNANVNSFSPANLNGVIAVGAVDPNNVRASFSNYGTDLFITAPGVNILSLGSTGVAIGTKIGNELYVASGTSMAAPFVSGAIALLLNKYPNASLKDIETLLAAGAVDKGTKGYDSYYGYGVLNIANSLNVTLPTTSSATQSATTSTAVSSTTTSTVKAKSFSEMWSETLQSVSDFFSSDEESDAVSVTPQEIERATNSLVPVGVSTYQDQLERPDQPH